MATLTVQDDFTGYGTTNGDDGRGVNFNGTFGLQQFDPDLGTLRSVRYRLDLFVTTQGGILSDDAFFGDAATFYGVDLDPGDDDGVGLDAFVGIQDGLSGIPLFVGGVTPVVYPLSKSSGDLAVADIAPFVGEGVVRVDFDAFSGTTAFGGALLGPQGNNFSNANSAIVTVEYTYDASGGGGGGGGGVGPITGTAKADKLNGTGGDDEILGLGGNDKLSGKAGDDELVGGAGKDKLTGGGGDDVFVFAAADGGGDRVKDFGDGADSVDLSGFGGLSFGDLKLKKAGDDVRLTVDGVQIVFEDVAKGDLGADAFLL